MFGDEGRASAARALAAKRPVEATARLYEQLYLSAAGRGAGCAPRGTGFRRGGGMSRWRAARAAVGKRMEADEQFRDLARLRHVVLRPSWRSRSLFFGQGFNVGALAICNAALALLSAWFIVSRIGLNVETDAFFASGALPQLAFLLLSTNAPPRAGAAARDQRTPRACAKTRGSSSCSSRGYAAWSASASTPLAVLGAAARPRLLGRGEGA